MEESSDSSENPATGKMSGSQVNTDSDSGSSEYASAEEELGEGTEDGGRAVSPTQSAPASHAASREGVPCLAPTALPTSAVPSTSQTAPVARGPGVTAAVDRQPPDRGNTEGKPDRQPPDRGNTEGEPDSQVQETEDEPSVSRMTMTNSQGAHHNTQVYKADNANDRLQDIAARTSANLERACPQGYVRTLGYYRALGAVRKHHCCIITGTSGSGKTTLARHLLLAFQAEGFEAIELIEPSECKCLPWEEIRQGNRRLVLLVDNVMGAGNFEDELRRKWEKQLKHMNPFIECGHVLVILASRANIYAKIREVKKSGQVLYEAPEVFLGGEDCQLSEEERKEILKKTLEIHGAKLPDRVSIHFIIEASVTKIGFPQLCVYLATKPTALSDPYTFFRNPVQYLEKEFQSMKLDDKLSYFVLILVLLREGKLSEEFMKAKENKEFFIDIADLVDLSECPRSGGILERAKQLCESYLEYDSQSKCFSFTHQSVWDVLFSEMCHSDFEKAASVCTFKQLVMYVRTDPKCEEEEEFVYVVPPCDWPILAKRLLQELTCGDADLACSHPCLQHPDFVQELLEKLLTDTDISRLLDTHHEKKIISMEYSKLNSLEDIDSIHSLKSHLLTIFSFQSCISYLPGRSSSVAKHILQSAQFKDLSPSIQSQLLNEALACALYVSAFDMVEWLLDRGAVPSQECVRAACCAEQEHVRLVERALLSNRVLGVELLTEMARVACQKDRPNTLELVLSRLPKSASTQAELDIILSEVILLTHPKYNRYDTKKLSHLSCILSTLKRAGAQFRTHIDPHTAAGHSDPSALSEWLEHDVDLSATDKDGYTLMHHAAKTGALGNVQALLKDMESTGQLAQLVNVQTRMGDTALHLAAENGRLAVIETLVKKVADANVIKCGTEAVLSRLASCGKWEMEGYVSPSEDQMAASSSSQSSAFQSQGHDVSDMRVKDLLRMLVTNTISFENSLTGSQLRMAFCEDQILLNEASLRGHCLLVEVLMERGVDVNVRDDRWRTPVHHAAESGHVDVLEVLSRNEAQLDARDSEGQTALHVAAGWGRLPVVEMLIQNKVNINCTDGRERSPLHQAAEGGDDQVVKCLLVRGATVNATDKDGLQPLHLAAGGGHFSAVKCLVEGGASVNAKCRVGRTCLHFASANGDFSTLELLLTHSAGVNASDDEGLTPLHWALMSRSFHAAQLLMFSSANENVVDHNGNTMLHSLAASKPRYYSYRCQADIARMASLVRRLGGSVNCQNKQGDTPVMLAVGKRDYKVLREMLRLQCDLSISNDAGNTALHLAAAQVKWNREEKEAEECMSIISAKCVKLLDVKNFDGDVPLLLVAGAGNISVLKGILKHSVDLSVKGKGGNTILHELVCGLNGGFTNRDESVSEIVETLVRRCPDLINSTNDEGDTPVLTAARNGQWFLLSLFLKHPVDFSVKNKGGNTILHKLIHGLSRGFTNRDESVSEIVETLVRRCPDLINSTNDEGDTPVLTAARNGQLFLLSLFLKHPVDFSVKGKEGNTILHKLIHGLSRGFTNRDESVSEIVETLVRRCPDLINSTNDEGDTPVLTAARKGQLFLLSLFLKHPVDFSVKSKGGNTILHELICGSNKWDIERDEALSKVVESVVQSCADLINSINDKGDTPILTTAKEGQWILLSLFLKQNCDVRARDRRGNTFLHCLAKSAPPMQHQATLKAIIADLAEIVDRANEDEDSTLMVAAHSGNAWMVRELVALQCNVRMRNKKGETALFLAIKHGHFSVVEMLLEQDVDVNIQTEEESTLLHALAESSNLDDQCKKSEAVRKTVKTLLEKCISFASCPNSRGETPLYLAFLHGNWCVADLLPKQAGPSVDCGEGGLTDKPQETAGLSLAQEGVRTPLHGLAASRHPEGIPFWVKKFSHWINHPDPEGNTPIVLALREGNFCVAEQLVQCGADLSVTDAEGNTVLHALAQLTAYYKCWMTLEKIKSNKAVVVKVTELAKAAGVTPLTPNKEGKTAVDVFRQIGRKTHYYDSIRAVTRDPSIKPHLVGHALWHWLLKDLWLIEDR